MRVGFTGTREGMSPSQYAAFVLAFPQNTTLFRHGVCVGADEQATLHVNSLEPRPTIFGHFSDMPRMTSESASNCCDDTAQPESPLDRNRHIVDGCDMLMACPKGPEELRSGTWSTVRYARKRGKRIVIIMPDGSITKEK